MTETQNKIQEGLQNLNDKISKVKKNITYYDLVNIVDTVNTKEEYSLKVNALLPNSALIINAQNTFNEDNQVFSTGDIVLKMADNTLTHIKTRSGGIYYPAKIDVIKNDNNEITGYNLNYKYQGTTPDPGSVFPGEEPKSEADKAAENMSFIVETGKKESSNIYGIWKEIDISKPSLTFSSVGDSTSPIKPMIKFYIELSDKSYEEVILDYSLTYNEASKEYTINIQNLSTNIFAKVK